MAVLKSIPSRSLPRTGHNPALHDHSDNSSGGRISGLFITHVEQLTSTMDHGLLLGLADDDHLQYFKHAGRATPQTAAFGTASGAATGLLTSTSHATKGGWFFGAASFFNEALTRLGIGETSPDAALHVKATPSAGTIVPSGDITAIDTEWGRYSSGGGPPAFATTWQHVNTSDDDTSFIAQHTTVTGVHTYHFNMGGTIAPAASYSITARCEVLFGASFTLGQVVLGFTLYDSAGTPYATPTIDGSTITTSWANYAFTATASGGATSTANSLKITTVVASNPDRYLACTYITLAAPGGSGGDAIAIFEQGGSTSLPFSLWINSSGTTVSSVDSAGMGRFQNLALEDAGAGTGAVTLKAPTGLTSWSFTFPSDDGNANEVLITDGAGATDWVALSTLSWAYVQKTTTYPITTSDYFIDCTSGTFTVTLPTAVGVTGRVYCIKNSGSGVITVATTSAQTIDGGSTATIRRRYTVMCVISDGSNWAVH